jgi:hypothetical protein
VSNIKLLAERKFSRLRVQEHGAEKPGPHKITASFYSRAGEGITGLPCAWGYEQSTFCF